MNLYNELDAYPAAWLRNLIADGHIAPGTVDERSIVGISPKDLAGVTQFHAFAGIGVWSHALRAAGWAEDTPVWTGSCPCQPFSAAGRRRGADDERHLWPAWFRLIHEFRPPVVFGEQVASGDGLAWLDAVQSDLEGEGYAVGALDLCAAGVGAPHIRQRIFFVAHAVGQRRAGERLLLRAEESGRHASRVLEAAGRGETYGPTHPAGSRPGFWSDAEWIPCRDGKARPVEPGTFPLVDGAPARVGRLRAYGNAIVAPLAEQFIRAYMNAAPVTPEREDAQTKEDAP